MPRRISAGMTIDDQARIIRQYRRSGKGKNVALLISFPPLWTPGV